MSLSPLAFLITSSSVVSEVGMASKNDSGIPEDDLERKHYMEVSHKLLCSTTSRRIRRDRKLNIEHKAEIHPLFYIGA